MRFVSRFFAVVVASLCLLCASRSVAQTVIISEIMAAGQNVVSDEDGEYPDWIELQNMGAVAVNLANWSLTDNAALPQKWKFTSASIPAGEFLVVFASGKNRASGDTLHTSFSLTFGGEYLALVRPNGTVASELTFPAQVQSISYGMAAGERRFFQTPTPGLPNSAAFLDISIAPKFNRQHGFQNTPFNLVMATDTVGASIRYTLDGTAPSDSAGLVYSAPIAVSKTTVVRAVTVKADYLISPVTTASYIFTADVVRQSPNGETPAGGWPTPPQGAYGLNYGMDPAVVDSPLYRGTIQSDLRSIPTLSLVCDLNDLYHADTGIWSHPYEQGQAWERPMSLELIDPNGGLEFTQPGGMRVRGGASRDPGNPKHSFRIFFRGKYGDDTLDGKFFGEDGANRFAKFDIRNDQIISWHLTHDPSTRFIQDQFLRDTVRLAGFPSTRGSFYHVYINGQYWGMSNTEERPEGDFAATYFGGKAEDYDVINKGEVTQGDISGWERAITFAKKGLGSNAAYQKLQGLNADGTRNPQFEPLVDVDSVIMYMLVGSWMGVRDTPADHGTQNNWYQIKSRTGKFGMRFLSHDSEISMGDVADVFIDPSPSTKPFEGLEAASTTPWHMWEALRMNAEFRLRVADFAHRFFFNDGLMSPDNADRRWRALMAQIDRAVVCESARLGDFSVWDFGGPLELYTRATWLAACDYVLNEYLPKRGDVILDQLLAAGLYPATPAPVFSQFGGVFQPGATVAMTTSTGTIYYTVDGSDPRKIGGAISGKARAFSAPVPLSGRIVVNARVRQGENWSALTRAEFVPAQDVSGLRISEIHYNPPAVGAVSGDEFEFLELANDSTVAVDLSGFRFLSGITFEFPSGTKIQPGAFYVLARNGARFTEAHPGRTANGIYEGKLDNGGEEISIVAANGAVILAVTYDDETPWPITADGLGFSIVYRGAGEQNDGANWAPSAQSGGSPGVVEPSVTRPLVLVNEVRSRSATAQADAIEILNASVAPVDISGWWLSDNSALPKKYRVPAGSVIAAGGFLVFAEPQFNPTPGAGGNSFGLDATGDSVWLFAANAAGDLTGYFHGFRFGASDVDVSFGRHVTSDLQERFVAQASVTLAAVNSGPRTPAVQIAEIHYQPSPTGNVSDEFIELRNKTGAAIPLEGWRIAGLDFVFPAGAELAAGAMAIVSSLDPPEFRTRYSVPPEVPVFGAALGILQNSGERVEIRKPGPPDSFGVPSLITVDSVRYNDHQPWPSGAAGAGPSLQLVASASFSDDPQNWFASGPTPGGASVFNAPPSVTLLAPVNGASFTQPRPITLTADADDSDGAVAKVQFFDGEQLIGEDAEAPFSVVWTGASTGNHDVIARAVDDGGAVSDTNANVVLVRPPGAGIGVGLFGQYYSTEDFTGSAITRVDPQIDFDFGSDPIEGISAQPYSIRWTGFLRAARTGEYTVTVNTTSRVSLTVGSETGELEEKFTLDEVSVTVFLSAGQLVPLRLDLVETFGDAQVYLNWSGPGVADGLIPETNLYGPDQDPDALGISTAARLPNARRKSDYSLQLNSENGVAPYHWVATGLPQGIVLSPEGMLTGRPTVAGDNVVQIEMNDSTNQVVSKTFRLRVRAAFDDGPRPVLTVLSPQNNARLGRGGVTFSGTAKHPNGIESVEYSINGEPWQNGELTDDGWRLEIDTEARFRSGSNSISFRANEPAGSQSPVVARSVQVVLSRALRISVFGQGSVSGALLGENIVRNRTMISVTARPAQGNIFLGWSGLDKGEVKTPTLSIVVDRDMDLTANFSPTPRNERPGTYVGLLGLESDKPADRGRFTVSLTKDSFFTAVIQRGTVKTRLKGRFTFEGNYFVIIPSDVEGIVSYLFLAFDPNDDTAITGDISRGGIVIDGPRRLAGGDNGIDPPLAESFTLRRSNFSAANPCPLAGLMSISLRSSLDWPATEGHGYASASVLPSGKTRLVGVLGNGVKWKASATVNAMLELPIYSAVHNGRGSLSGVMRFAVGERNPGDGELLWLRPKGIASPSFPEPHIGTLTVSAQTYTPPKGAELPLPSLNYGVILNAAEIASFISGSAVLSPGGVWAFGATDLTPAPMLRIDPKTGIANGSIVLPGATMGVPLRGIVNQLDNTLFGHFPSAHGSGALEIRPPGIR